MLLRCALPLLLTLQLSACTGTGSDSLVGEGQVPVSIAAVSYYGKGIGISDFYVNGKWGGVQYDGWAGGAPSVCCVNLPRDVKKPLQVTVKWKTYRTNFKEERWHEAKVPVHFSENEPGNLYVYFLPGHKVEVWSSEKYGPGNPNYHGPAYPSGPAPDYVPLHDEKPDPTSRKMS